MIIHHRKAQTFTEYLLIVIFIAIISFLNFQSFISTKEENVPTGDITLPLNSEEPDSLTDKNKIHNDPNKTAQLRTRISEDSSIDQRSPLSLQNSSSQENTIKDFQLKDKGPSLEGSDIYAW